MVTSLAYDKAFAFNAICPYYTMFPLEYPMRLLRKHTAESPTVFDPFCGRGTTIYAARKLGLRSYGLDTSPIASAISQAKLANAELSSIITLAKRLISENPAVIPENSFFERAFSRDTLKQICSLRKGLLREAKVTNESAILRAAILGCLHGPLPKGNGEPSYFSNQMPRTFASKPDYSVKYWRERGLFPPSVSVIDVLSKKLKRISDLNAVAPSKIANIKCLDSRKLTSFKTIKGPLVTVTSPPYYGMRTYVQDQWLRMWFLGGGTEINYENTNQLCHGGQKRFVEDLAKVWRNIGERASNEAHLYVRFGSISSAKSDAKEILQSSLHEAGNWKLISVRNAQTAHFGKRQADQMGRESQAANEYDFHAVRN